MSHQLSRWMPGWAMILWSSAYRKMEVYVPLARFCWDAWQCASEHLQIHRRLLQQWPNLLPHRCDAVSKGKGVTIGLIRQKYHVLVTSGIANSQNSVCYHDTARGATAKAKSLSEAGNFGSGSKLFIWLHSAFMLATWIGAPHWESYWRDTPNRHGSATQCVARIFGLGRRLPSLILFSSSLKSVSGLKFRIIMPIWYHSFNHHVPETQCCHLQTITEIKELTNI